MGFENDLAAWAAGDVRVDSADEDVARAVLLDSLAVMATGIRTRAAQAVARAPLGSGDGECPVVGTRSGASPAAAALRNGTAGAAELWDDTSLWMNTHSSVPIVAGLVSAATGLRPSYGEFLAAYVVGMETEMALRSIAGHSMYLRGYHNTGLLGPAGVAAAVARLRGAEPEVVRNAIGIAASMGAGMRVQFGSDVMPLHSGLAAERGLAAVELAEAGIRPDPQALTGRYGFAECYSDTPERPGSWDGPLGLATAEIVLKQYPVGAPNMAPVDAALRVREAFGGHLDAARIRSIACKADRWIEYTIGLDVPRAPSAGRVNLPYCVIAALLHGEELSAAFLGEEPLPDDVRRLIGSFTVEVGDYTDDAGQPVSEIVVATDEAEHGAWSSASAYVAPTLAGDSGAIIRRKALAAEGFRAPAEEVVDFVVAAPAERPLEELLALV